MQVDRLPGYPRLPGDIAHSYAPAPVLFEHPDGGWVVGFGMDVDGEFGDLDEIAVVSE